MIEKKTCKNCKTLFKPRNPLEKYCSEICRRKARASDQKRYLAKKNDPKKTKQCKTCGKHFQTTQGHQKHCSTQCREKSKVKSNKKRLKKMISPNKQKRCKKCRKKFTKKHKHQNYCSRNCERTQSWENRIKGFKTSNNISMDLEHNINRRKTISLGTIHIPLPPTNADEKDWKKYHENLEKILKTLKKIKNPLR